MHGAVPKVLVAIDTQLLASLLHNLRAWVISGSLIIFVDIMWYAPVQ